MILDSGIVIRFLVESDPDHSRVIAKVEELTDEGWELCYAPQAIRETWNVLTRPTTNGGYAWTPEKTSQVLRILKTSFVLLEESLGVFEQWQRLVAKYRIVGKSVHDANVVAVALAHGASHVLTLNERDFRRYAEVELIVP